MRCEEALWISGGGSNNLMNTGDSGDVVALNTSDKHAVLAAFQSNPRTYVFDRESGNILMLNCIGQVLRELRPTKEVAPARTG
jgi:hypothetical protein